MPSEEQWNQDRTRFAAIPIKDNSYEAGPLGQQFTLLTEKLLNAKTVAEVLDQLVKAAVNLVPGTDLASITLRKPDGTFHTPIETDPIAAELDQIQYKANEGPCVDAARVTGTGFSYSNDLGRGDPWPIFGPAAAAHGMKAVLATTLQPDAKPPLLSGALNLYSREHDGFNADAPEIGLLLGTYASLALTLTHAVTASELQAAQFHQALESRDIIGQAKGILMHRRGISADEAFDLLRRTSQDLNIKLADLAATLASRHSELDMS